MAPSPLSSPLGGEGRVRGVLNFGNLNFGIARPVKYEHYFFVFWGADSEETELNL